MIKPAIVIPVFKRTDSLKRLLWSIERAFVPMDVPLIFRYHYGASKNVVSFIENYNWPFGEKRIIYDDEHLDLHENLKRCGDLSIEYQAIVLLEDDCLVSPYFYDYAQKAIEKYNFDDRVAQISLYRYSFNPIDDSTFHPIQSKSSVFALTKTSSYGEVFTANQWKSFRNWLSNRPAANYKTPSRVHSFGANSWELHHTQYMVETKKWSIWPHLSVSSNQSPAGIHHHNNIDADFFQVPMQNHPIEYNFSNLDDCYRYDAFYELDPSFFTEIANSFTIPTENLIIDIQGFKPLDFDAEFWLTSKPCKHAIATFSDTLKPVELNVLWQYAGNGISLCRKSEIINNAKSDPYKLARKYFSDNTDVGLKNFLHYKWLKYVERKRLKK